MVRPRPQILALLVLAALAAPAVAASAAAVANAAGASGSTPLETSPAAILTGALTGQVLESADPLPAVRVYAYQLADLSLRQVTTDRNGRFLFETLPAGLYKVIAVKAGFVPAVVRLSRATAEARQFLEVQLAASRPEDAVTGAGFWTIREQLPADVLRELGQPTGEELAAVASERSLISTAAFGGEVQAMTGFDVGPTSGEAQVASGRVGLRGQVAGMRVGLSGNFWTMETAAPGESRESLPDTGQMSALSLRVESPGESELRVSSFTNRLVTSLDGEASTVDYEHYRVSWSQPIGEDSRSDFAAQYTAENNYYRHGLLEPLTLPETSRSWRLEGSYTTPLTDRTTLQTGFRYRQRDQELAPETLARLGLAPAQQVDLFGQAGWELRPAVVVEYGLYSTLRDGRVSLLPRGGIVLRLPRDWQVAASGSRSVYDEDPARLWDFTPALYEEGRDCQNTEAYCYRVLLSREWGEGEAFSIAGLQRRFDETLRLFFPQDLFHQGEGLYLLPGDTLPEVHLGITQRLTPSVLTRLESTVAAGGGGRLPAGSLGSYENEVRYVVTSLDTRFEPTSTGVFVAFHQLEQQLIPAEGEALEDAHLELERLQLMVSQNLNFLLDLAADWAVQVNMEVSRGGTREPAVPADDELRRRVMGGIAIKF